MSIESHQALKGSRRKRDRERLLALRSGKSFAAAFEEAEPLVSIYIPTYERAELILKRTLPSVYRQDYENWEVLVIGDDMEESQAALLQGIKHKRVSFRNLKRRGRYPADPVGHWYTAGMKPGNFALRVARGRWITPLDDDDEFLPTHISSLLKLAQDKRVEWVYGKVVMRGSPSDHDLVVGQLVPEMGRIANVSSLYHAGLKEFRYNPDCWKYGYPADWDLWDRFLEMGVTHEFLDEVVSICFCRPAVYRSISE